MHHLQGDYNDIGGKVNYSSTNINNANNKKILNIYDQHGPYGNNLKKLGSTPKLCQKGILNNGNGINVNSKSENHHYNNNGMCQGYYVFEKLLYC